MKSSTPKDLFVALSAFVGSAVTGMNAFSSFLDELTVATDQPDYVALGASETLVDHKSGVAFFAWREHAKRSRMHEEIAQENVSRLDSLEGQMRTAAVARSGSRGDQQVIRAVSVQVMRIGAERAGRPNALLEVSFGPGPRITDHLRLRWGAFPLRLAPGTTDHCCTRQEQACKARASNVHVSSPLVPKSHYFHIPGWQHLQA